MPPGIRLTVSVRKNRIPQVINEMTTNAAQAVSETIAEAGQRAKALARVDTGEMRGSVRGTVDGLKGVLETDVEHSIYNEYGTRFLSAQPFMGPAMEAVRGRFHRRMEKILRG